MTLNIMTIFLSHSISLLCVLQRKLVWGKMKEQ